MKLISCHIDNFGLFSNFDFNFDENICNINRENGWGKTTLATFVKVMFYGMSAKGRNKEYVALRSKYKSWNSDGLFGGSLEFETKKSRYRVVRNFGAQPDKDMFKLYDLNTNLESNEYSQNLGYELFGVGEETFEMTTFFPQSALISSVTDDIRANLSGIKTNNDDVDKFTKANNSISKKIRELKSNISHDNDMSMLLYKVEEDKENSNFIKQKIASYEKKLIEIEKNKENSEKNLKKVQQNYDYYKNCLENIETNEDKISNLADSIDKLKQEKNSILEDYLNREKLEKFEEIKDKLFNKKRMSNGANLKNILMYLFMAIVIVSMASVIAVLVGFNAITLTVLCLSLLSFIPFIIILIKYIKAKKFVLDDESNEFFGKLKFNYDKVNEALKVYRERLVKFESIEEEMMTKNKELCDVQEKVSLLFKEIKNNFNMPFEVLENEKIEAEEQFNICDREVAILNNEIKNLNYNKERLEASIKENLSIIENKREDTDEVGDKVKILQTTISYLEQAKNNLSVKFLNPISRNFKKYFDLIDNNKNKLDFDVDLNIKLDVNSTFKEVEYMSAGYQDLIYFCKRLALIDLVFKREKPFIIFDDSFVNLDDDKIEKVNKLLNELSKDYQILNFTCSKFRTID